MSKNDPAESTVRDIRRKTRKQYTAEEKIRIVVSGLRGEESIAALCRREGIAEGLYFGNGLFATQAIKDNADLFFCRVLLTRCPADVLDRLGRTGLACLRFLSHLRSLRSLR